MLTPSHLSDSSASDVMPYSSSSSQTYDNLSDMLSIAEATHTLSLDAADAAPSALASSSGGVLPPAKDSGLLLFSFCIPCVALKFKFLLFVRVQN